MSAGSWGHLRVGREVFYPCVKPFLVFTQPSPHYSCSSDTLLSPPQCEHQHPHTEPGCNRAGAASPPCLTSLPLPETIAAQGESAGLCSPGNSSAKNSDLLSSPLTLISPSGAKWALGDTRQVANPQNFATIRFCLSVASLIEQGYCYRPQCRR